MAVFFGLKNGRQPTEETLDGSKNGENPRQNTEEEKTDVAEILREDVERGGAGAGRVRAYSLPGFHRSRARADGSRGKREQRVRGDRGFVLAPEETFGKAAHPEKSEG